jgi:hypothetical protein
MAIRFIDLSQREVLLPRSFCVEISCRDKACPRPNLKADSHKSCPYIHHLQQAPASLTLFQRGRALFPAFGGRVGAKNLKHYRFNVLFTIDANHMNFM